MKIVSLEAENIKHLRAININPDGSMVVIGGDNAQGKTCVLDSIEYALNGAGAIPTMPIRSGQKKARIVLDIGDIVVTRTFTQKGTNLTVRNKDGATFASPQAMLYELVGELTFDPLEFSKMDIKKQAEVLKQLVGLNFDKANALYRKLFEDRTAINRRGKETKANLDSMTKHDGVPDKEVSIRELGYNYTEAHGYNQTTSVLGKELEMQISGLQRLEKEAEALRYRIDKLKATFEGRKIFDAESIRREMVDAENINAKVRENRSYDVINSRLTELRKQSGSLSSDMTNIEIAKEKDLAKAKFPIKGLTIDDEGVMFEGIPFVQCSSAQRIRISVAIGLAMNPKLRVLLIREGSLLDEKNLAMVAKMADEADAQIWIERVSKGKECQVIIENGEVLEPEKSNA